MSQNLVKIIIDISQDHQTNAVEIGTLNLPETDSLMTELTELRLKDSVNDTILLLAHPASLSVGAKPLDHRDFLKPLEDFEEQGISLFKSVRGGGLTYHWPGQLVVYPIFKLRKDERNIPGYMYKLEEVGLRTLCELGIEASRKREKAAQIGLWIGNRKIASMGIHISRWITSYGFALNLYGDKSPANCIRPCGLEGVKLTTVEEMKGHCPEREKVIQILLENFRDVFEREIVKIDL